MAQIERICSDFGTLGVCLRQRMERRFGRLSGFALIFGTRGLSSTKDGTQMAQIERICTDFDLRESARSALSAFYSTIRGNLPNLRYQRSISSIIFHIHTTQYDKKINFDSNNKL